MSVILTSALSLQIKKRSGVDQDSQLKFVPHNGEQEDALPAPKPDNVGGQQQAPLHRGRERQQDIQGDMGKVGDENGAGDKEGDENPPKIYGPKAIFKDRVIGNYEPKFVSKSGPGELL